MGDTKEMFYYQIRAIIYFKLIIDYINRDMSMWRINYEY